MRNQSPDCSIRITKQLCGLRQVTYLTSLIFSYLTNKKKELKQRFSKILSLSKNLINMNKERRVEVDSYLITYFVVLKQPESHPYYSIFFHISLSFCLPHPFSSSSLPLQMVIPIRKEREMASRTLSKGITAEFLKDTNVFFFSQK